MLTYYQIYEQEYTFTSDIEFIETLMSEGETLEVGCGSGRVLKFLNENRSKYLLYGLDIDGEAVSIAKQFFSKEEVSLTVDDAISFSLDTKFKNILFLFNGLLHLGCRDKQASFMKNAYEHLSVGGNLFFYVSNPDINRMSERFPFYKYQKTLVVDDVIVDKYECNRFDLGTQMLHRIFNYDYQTEDGFLRRLVSRFTVRYMYRTEIELMLGSAGFKNFMIYGDYDGSNWTPQSPHIIVHAMK